MQRYQPEPIAEKQLRYVLGWAVQSLNNRFRLPVRRAHHDLTEEEVLEQDRDIAGIPTKTKVDDDMEEKKSDGMVAAEVRRLLYTLDTSPNAHLPAEIRQLPGDKLVRPSQELFKFLLYFEGQLRKYMNVGSLLLYRGDLFTVIKEQLSKADWLRQRWASVQIAANAQMHELQVGAIGKRASVMVLQALVETLLLSKQKTFRIMLGLVSDASNSLALRKGLTSRATAGPAYRNVVCGFPPRLFETMTWLCEKPGGTEQLRRAEVAAAVRVAKETAAPPSAPADAATSVASEADCDEESMAIDAEVDGREYRVVLMNPNHCLELVQEQDVCRVQAVNRPGGDVNAAIVRGLSGVEVGDIVVSVVKVASKSSTRESREMAPNVLLPGHHKSVQASAYPLSLRVVRKEWAMVQAAKDLTKRVAGTTGESDDEADRTAVDMQKTTPAKPKQRRNKKTQRVEERDGLPQEGRPHKALRSSPE